MRITGQAEQQWWRLPGCRPAQAWQEASGVPQQARGLSGSTSDEVDLRRVHSDEPAARIAEVRDEKAVSGLRHS